MYLIMTEAITKEVIYMDNLKKSVLKEILHLEHQMLSTKP